MKSKHSLCCLTYKLRHSIESIPDVKPRYQKVMVLNLLCRVQRIVLPDNQTQLHNYTHQGSHRAIILIYFLIHRYVNIQIANKRETNGYPLLVARGAGEVAT
jgi:hypothetical protein